MSPSSLFVALAALTSLSFTTAVPAASIFERSEVRNMSSACYFPAGNPAYDNVPCGDKGISGGGQCCASLDMCLPNGLCRVTTTDNLGVTADKGYEYARGSCTDPKWGPTCFNYCIGTQPDPASGFPGSPKSNGAAIFGCDKSAAGAKQLGYQIALEKGGHFCCETGVNSKDSCCSASTFSLCPTGTSCGGASTSTSTVAVPASGTSTTPSVAGLAGSTTPAPVISQITTSINGNPYTLPCSQQDGITIIIFPENLRCHTGCESGQTNYPSMGQVVNGSVISTSAAPFSYNPSSSDSNSLPVTSNNGLAGNPTTSTTPASTPTSSNAGIDASQGGSAVVPSSGSTSTSAYVGTGGQGYVAPSNTNQPIMVPSSDANMQGRVVFLPVLFGMLAILAAYLA